MVNIFKLQSYMEIPLKQEGSLSTMYLTIELLRIISSVKSLSLLTHT